MGCGACVPRAGVEAPRRAPGPFGRTWWEWYRKEGWKALPAGSSRGQQLGPLKTGGPRNSAGCSIGLEREGEVQEASGRTLVICLG